MSDAEVLKYIDGNPLYAKYKDNLPLARLLYQKSLNKNPIVRVMGNPFEVKIREIKNLPVQTKVAFRGLVAEMQQDTYKGCPDCRRKVCEHGKQLVDIIVTKMLIGDDTDMVWASGFQLKEDVKEGSEVEIVGSVKEWKTDKSVGIFELKITNKSLLPEVKVKPAKGSKEEKIQRIVQFVEASQKVALKMLQTMCEGEGVPFEEVSKLVLVDYKNNAVYPITEEHNYGLE